MHSRPVAIPDVRLRKMLLSRAIDRVGLFVGALRYPISLSKFSRERLQKHGQDSKKGPVGAEYTNRSNSHVGRGKQTGNR